MFSSFPVNCFHCQKEITIKYVYGLKMYSQKNNWGYWTGNSDYKKHYLCDDCLVKLYKVHKWEFRKIITDKKKQTRLRQYISKGIIKGKPESVFIVNRHNFLDTEQKKKKKQTPASPSKNFFK